jgi:hypothetical protein
MPGELYKLPVGEVVRVYPRSSAMHMCGVVDRGVDGFGAKRVCLSSKTVYSQESKHQASCSSGLPDFAELVSEYEEKNDGFVIVKVIEWAAHQQWPSVEVVCALWQMPIEQQLFTCLAVSHGLHVPLPLAKNPRNMFPFEEHEIEEAALASKSSVDCSDPKRVDMRALAVFTIDADVTVDLDDAMHCRKLPDGSYEVRGAHVPWCWSYNSFSRISSFCSVSPVSGWNTHRRRLSLRL